MSFTNSTPNYGLPQYIGTDKPTYLGDMNTAYSTIDTQMKANADAASAATSTANTAAATATAASTNATTALNTANSAASEAASATSAAASATSTANNAATDASTALRASAANSIENLAPAYDPTLTYAVGDLVTYIDENNSGKLYKCIVAVGTPEAFNINKWDDATTSEAYKKTANLVASVTVDSTMSFGDVLTALANAFTIDTDKEYQFVMDVTTGKSYCVGNMNYKETGTGHKSIVFTEISLQRDPYNLINDVFIIGGGYNKFIRTTVDSTGTTTYVDVTSGNAGYGTYKIYEI